MGVEKQLALGLVAGVLMLARSVIPAGAVDMQPGDFIPAPAGTNGFLLYLPYGHYDSAHIKGQDLEGGFDAYSAMARYVYFFDVAGMRADVNLVMPYSSFTSGNLGPVPLNSVSGFGDLSAVAALWLVNDPIANRYLAIVGYLGIPIGPYDPFATMNTASGRWSSTAQIGGVYGLGANWSIDAIADITFYGDNTNSNGFGGTLSQDPTVTAQLWLSYQATKEIKLSVGYGFYTGGNQYFDGAYTGINSGRQQIRAAASLWVTPTFQVLGQINTDFATTGGFEQNVSSLIRLLQLF